MKVLLAPSNVANQSTAIAAGLRTIGNEAQIWNYGPSPNGFCVDRQFDLTWFMIAALRNFLDIDAGQRVSWLGFG